MPTVRSEPVVLVHGWGGSFATTWQAPGWEALLQDAGRTVIGVDLLGHGTAPKPHDPAEYADLTTRIVEAIPATGQIDAIGFSMGAMTLLELAIRSPERFGRLVVAGIGKNVFEDDPERRKIIIDAVEGRETEDNIGRLFSQYSQQPGNDAAALAAVMKRTGERGGVVARLLGVLREQAADVVLRLATLDRVDDDLAALRVVLEHVLADAGHHQAPEALG